MTFPMIPVDSSNIQSVGYFSEKRILRVKFSSGGAYDYHEVPEQVYANLMASDSKGSFISRFIVKVFGTSKVGVCKECEGCGNWEFWKFDDVEKSYERVDINHLDAGDVFEIRSTDSEAKRMVRFDSRTLFVMESYPYLERGKRILRITPYEPESSVFGSSDYVVLCSRGQSRVCPL